MAKKTKSTKNTMPNYNQILEEQTKALASQEKAAIKSSDASYDAQGKIIKENYAGQISDAEKSYDSAYRDNAVQKKVNEFKIAEDMANMGLSNSGLSRMQVTANNLSYANKKGEITKQKQSMVDSLTRDMTALLGELDINKQNAAQGIKDNYAAKAQGMADTVYAAALEDYYYKEELAREKAAQAAASSSKSGSEEEPKGLISMNGALVSPEYEGSLASQGINVIYGDNGKVTYVDTKSGKKTTFDAGISPYTGTRHKDIVDVSTDAYDNGYQPNNINGNRLHSAGGAKIKRYGREYNVLTYNDKDCYYWDRKINDYVKLTEEEKKALGL